MFKIDVTRFWWIQDNGDDPLDLCLHGHVVAKIGNRILEDDCTVSATALYLLKSLTKDHIINTEIQMLPCCGHFYIPNDHLTEVDIDFCPNGTDWSIVHENGKIKLVLEDGYETVVPFDEYRNEVYRFADSIESYYNSCQPKIIEGEFEKNGYTAFWNEWHTRRNN